MSIARLIQNANFHYISVFLLGFLLYVNTLPNGYVLDDTIAITQNRHTKKGVDGILNILLFESAHGFSGEAQDVIDRSHYRPLSLITFALEYEFFGANPRISHLINALLYGITGVFLLAFLQQILKSRLAKPYTTLVPFLITLLYVAHPIHTEIVANIKARDEILSFLFSLTAMSIIIAMIRVRLLGKFLLAPLFMVTFMLALLSKETAISMLLIFPLVMYFFTNARKRDYALTSIPFAATFAGYYFIRDFNTSLPSAAIMQDVLNNPFALVSAPGEKYSTILFTWGKYLQLLLFPHPLSHDYDFNQIPMRTWGDPVVLLLAAGALGALAYAFLRFKKRDIYAFSILFFFITILANSNVFPVFPTGKLMAESFLYVPSLAFSMATGWFIYSALNRLSLGGAGSYPIQPQVSFLVLALLAAYSFKTVIRNAHWESNFTLAENDLLHSPNSAKLRHYLGATKLRLALEKPDTAEKRDLLIRAKQHLQKSVEIYPRYVKSWALLGDVHAHLDDFAEAQNCYDKALEINPKYAKVHQHLADVHYHEGNYRAAIKGYLNLIKNDSKNKHHLGLGFLGIGKSYEKLHSLDSAMIAYQTVVAFDSTIAEVYNRLGQVKGKRQGSMHASIQYYNKTLHFDPKNAEAHRYLGEAYYKMGDQERAISHFNKSIALEPEKAELYLNLAEAYSKIGDAKSAQANLERAYALNPKLKEE